MVVAGQDGGVYQFNAAGRHKLTREALTGDTLLSFGYDNDGRLATVTDADDNESTVERNGQGRPTAFEGPFGQRTTFSLDTAGYLASVTNPNGERMRMFYSPLGLLDSLADPKGQVHRFEYDSVGRLVRDDNPADGFQTLARTQNDTSYTVTIATALDRTTKYRVERLPTGATRRVITYPAGLAAVRLLGMDGSTTDSMPDGSKITMVEQADPRWGLSASILKSLTVRMPSGLTSTTIASRVADMSSPANPFSLTTQTDTVQINGERFVTVYQAGTRRFTTTTPEGRQTITRTDVTGRPVMERLVGLDSVTYQYDSRGLLSQMRSGGRLWDYGYDADGRLVTMTDPVGRRDSLFYDDADRVERRVLPGGREVLFAYDSSGNVVSVTPPGQPSHAFDYTPVDLTSEYTPPAAGFASRATQYEYDLDQQLTRVLRPDSLEIVFDYDTAGRPSTVEFDRGELEFSYQPETGQLTEIAAPGGNTLAFNYDGSLPKTVTWDGTVEGAVGVTYDANFRVIAQTVNGGSSLAFGYDRDGLLTAAGDLGVKRVAQTGLPARDSLDGVLSVWDFSSRGALAGHTASLGTDTLFRAGYVRDSLDRITGLTETVDGVTSALGFTYDSAGRLFEVRRNGTLTATYEYDANGNRIRLTTPNGVLTRAYDDQDRLLSDGGTNYGYGSNGELRTKAVSGDTTRYSYDALGNLTAVTLPDGTAITYVIDGQNRRVGKRVNGTLVQGFLYESQLRPVAELNGAQQVVSRFVYGDQPNVPEYLIKGGVAYRLVLDHLGSVRLVVKTTDGTVAQRLEYDEYGRVTVNTAPGFQPFGFAGGLLDQQTGLVRFGARDYDAESGRWTAKDPIEFAGGDPNFYAYVENDPLNFVDPNGFGRVGLFVRTVKGAWKQISRLQADKLLDNAGARILVEGPGSSKKARSLAKQKFGAKKVRHDGHRPGERPHWQHKNGGRGKLMYSLNVGANLGVCTFGDNLIGNLIDFLNPLSDINDLVELGADLLGDSDDDADDE